MSINVENIKYAIEVMKRAKNLQMESFQMGTDKCEDIDSLHQCGNTACFVGYMALTPLWKQFLSGQKDEIIAQILEEYDWLDEGINEGMLSNCHLRFDYDGVVVLTSSVEPSDLKAALEAEDALAQFLGISTNLAKGFIYDMSISHNSTKKFYDVPFNEVKPEHVIEKLNQLLKGELK